MCDDIAAANHVAHYHRLHIAHRHHRSSPFVSSYVVGDATAWRVVHAPTFRLYFFSHSKQVHLRWNNASAAKTGRFIGTVVEFRRARTIFSRWLGSCSSD